MTQRKSLSSGSNEEYGLTLFISIPENSKEITWNWLLKEFNEEPITVNPSPCALILIEHIETDITYVVTFGHAFFYVDKYCEHDFGFKFAKKMTFENIKTTTLTTQSSTKNKTVNSYIDYDSLEFDSGESFAKLKAKILLPDGFSLFKSSVEIGTSIKFSINKEDTQTIVEIIKYVEHILDTSDDNYKIPLFAPVKDDSLISKLDTELSQKIKEGLALSISEFDIVGATEVFNRNDDDYTLSYGRAPKKSLVTLSQESLKAYCTENHLNFESDVLKIKVTHSKDGHSVNTTSVKDLIDYLSETNRCLLSKGKWYQFNDDYAEYLDASINEIHTEFHPEYDFPNSRYESFITDMQTKETSSDSDNAPSRETLKRKYYSERSFNLIMERDHEFTIYDRALTKTSSSEKVELMDLYKDCTMFAVKIGNSSEKLCYAIDQSLASLRLYKHKAYPEMPEIQKIALWFVLERKKTLPNRPGTTEPDINQLHMFMLRNKIDHWKKEVRLAGYQPIIYINYRT